MNHRTHFHAPFLVIAMSILLAASTSNADEDGGITESLLDRICNPDEPEDARRACELLWQTATAEDMPALLRHPHPNVSLRAAWRRAILTADKARDSDRYFVPSPEAMHRFVGFMEGSLDVPLPEWWVTVILQTQSSDGSRFTFPPDSVPFYPPSESGIRGPEHILLERSDADLSMTIDGITLPVPIASGELLDAVSGIKVDDVLFVATHSGFPRDYTLWSLDSGGAELWRSTVWAANEDAYYTGRCHQFVELVESAGTLYVFGATSGCAYVEAFDAESGDNVFRFSTSC